MAWVAGADGCRAGWVVVLRELDTARTEVVLVPRFRELLDLSLKPSVVAIDVPIGLAPVAQPGGRTCEVAARKALGRRASSVFSSPTRPALEEFRRGGSYRAVVDANRGGAPDAPGISQQCFAILKKIDDVDREIVPALQSRIYEVHPEFSFARANGGVPMRERKTLRGGRAERLEVLERVGFAAPLESLGRWSRRQVRPDDLADACIAAWTAERIHRGVADRWPARAECDPHGLDMALWA